VQIPGAVDLTKTTFANEGLNFVVSQNNIAGLVVGHDNSPINDVDGMIISR
jgi:hypothetical protein